MRKLVLSFVLLATSCSSSTQLSQEQELNSDEQMEIMRNSVDLYDEGKYDAALQGFESVLQSSPNNSLALYESALTLQALGNFDECAKRAKKVVKINSDNREYAYQIAAVCLDMGGKKKEALKILDEGLKLYNTYLPHYTKAVVYHSMGNFEESTSSYKQGLVLNRKHHNAHFGLAASSFVQNRTVTSLAGMIVFALVEEVDSPRKAMAQDYIRKILDGKVEKKSDQEYTINITDLLAAEGEKESMEESIQSQVELMLSMASIANTDKGPREALYEQFKLFLEIFSQELSNHSDSKDFLASIYGPFLSELEKSDHKEAVFHAIMVGSDIDGVDDWLVENDLALDKLNQWLNELTKQQNIVF